MKSKNLPKGLRVMQDPTLNKGTAFSEAERDALGLRGLVPPHVQTIDDQVQRFLITYQKRSTDLERYIDLSSLQDRNETLYYHVVTRFIEQMMPIIYTPTVGLACQQFGQIFRRSHGMYISERERGHVAKVLQNWPRKDIRVIVVTDGERILGLGDLGANGMGIPIGKLALYTACAGIHPTQCLPVLIDVGTNNQSLLDDPLYLGVRQRRSTGEAYDALVDEFITAAAEVFPKALIQFEDFANHNAFRYLQKYRDRVRTFNDDIQGTASVALAGIYSALRVTGKSLRDQRFLFFGAGEAGTGVGELMVMALMAEGLTEQEAIQRCWFIDSKGLVVKSRTDLKENKLHFAQDHAPLKETLAIIEAFKPTALIGASGQPGTFSRQVLEAVTRLNERPIIFALSNPTSKAECTAAQAYEWSGGKAVFASGSPFHPVEFNGKRYVPGQGNNAYIFPGIGLGVIAAGSRLVTDEMFLTAARTLANLVTETDLAQGRIYPPLSQIRNVSLAIAVAVARVAQQRGLAEEALPDDFLGTIRAMMYRPEYVSLV
ncbi:MAG: NAD-dependent malic enzyme [Chthoniobacteraceae bacterium]|nr:NAD-dependent malic enzyme [Chthoniobacteraceae bacterium]